LWFLQEEIYSSVSYFNKKTPDQINQGSFGLAARYDNMLLIRLLVFFLFEFSLLLKRMLGLLSLFLLGFILFACVTHMVSPFDNSFAIPYQVLRNFRLRRRGVNNSAIGYIQTHLLASNCVMGLS